MVVSRSGRSCAHASRLAGPAEKHTEQTARGAEGPSWGNLDIGSKDCKAPRLARYLSPRTTKPVCAPTLKRLQCISKEVVRIPNDDTKNIIPVLQIVFWDN